MNPLESIQGLLTEIGLNCSKHGSLLVVESNAVTCHMDKRAIATITHRDGNLYISCGNLRGRKVPETCYKLAAQRVVDMMIKALEWPA